MTRRIAVALLCLALALGCVSASAVTYQKLTKYKLVVGGQPLDLSIKTGYVFRVGSKLMLPMEKLCDALSLKYAVSNDRRDMTITRADGVVLQLRVGSKLMKVGDEKVKLRLATARQDGRLITADIAALPQMGYAFKHYKPSAALKKMGYPSGAVAVAEKGGDLTLPDLSGGGEQGDDTSALPAELLDAAKETSQIVAVQYLSGSSAKLRLFTKNAKGVWSRQLVTAAYVGKKGIGKTKEEDNKTPTGTFNLTTPFGIQDDPGSKMAGYLKVTKNHYWCSTSGSPYYNQLVDVSKVSYTPTAADEHLIKYTGSYDYAMFIDYNKAGAEGKGSAIFLHCGQSATAGCVAVETSIMRGLMRVLKDGAKIVIY